MQRMAFNWATILLFLMIPIVLEFWYAILIFAFYPAIIITRLKDEEDLLTRGLALLRSSGYRKSTMVVCFKEMDNYDFQVDIGKQIFLQYDQELLIGKFRLEADEQYIYLTYLNTPCRIGRSDGGIEESIEGEWKECRSFSTVMTIYDLLCYPKGADAPALSGQWCAVGNFVVTGVTNTETFTKKYAAKFDGYLEELKVAAQGLGGVLLERMAGADLTCKFQVTPFFPVLMQFWEGDDEFEPKLMLLWDRNTDKFMHFETTFYLQGDLLERLWDRMKK